MLQEVGTNEAVSSVWRGLLFLVIQSLFAAVTSSFLHLWATFSKK